MGEAMIQTMVTLMIKSVFYSYFLLMTPPPQAHLHHEAQLGILRGVGAGGDRVVIVVGHQYPDMGVDESGRGDG